MAFLDEERRLRAASGAVFVAAIALAIFSSPAGALAITALCVVRGGPEFLAMRRVHHETDVVGLMGALTMLWVGSVIAWWSGDVATTMLPWSGAAAWLWLVGRSLLTQSKPLESLMQSLLGLGLLGPAIAMTPQISQHDTWTPGALLMLFVFLWSSDSFAYIGGRALGRTKLSPVLSPNKTWEGFLSGAAGAMALGWLGCWLGAWNLSPAVSILLGAAVAVVGTMGDLLESALKREAGVKDSGTWLPGHGGFLDRFDSFLFAAPLFAWWLHLLR